MSQHNHEIRQLASTISVGETSTNQTCPFCRGGRTKEASFAVTRIEQGVLYICYRATCQAKGFVATNPALINPYEPGFKRKQKQFKPKHFTKKTRTLTDEEYSFFYRRFQISPEELAREGTRWVLDGTSRVWHPVRDIQGLEVGGIARHYPELAPKSLWRGPKAIAYPEVDRDWAHFINHSPKGPAKAIVLVEDHLSAIRLAQFVDSCALLGTNITLSLATEISQRYHQVVLALDPDARRTALRLQSRYSLLFGNFSVALLSKCDPKEMTDEEIEESIIRLVE